MDEEALVRERLDDVLRYVHSVARHFPWCELEDLEQAALEALVKAAQRFDPARGAPFAAFVHLRIRGAVFDEARRNSTNTRKEMREGVRRYVGSIDELERTDEPGEEDPGYRDIELYTEIARLPARERLVVTLVDLEGLPQSKVGEFLGVCEARVSQIRSKALRRMRARLEAAA